MADAEQSPLPPDSYLLEPGRLAALAKTGLADSIAEDSFDRLTRLAAKFLNASVTLVSLVDDKRQFFKSCVGLPEPWASRRETPLTHSFCQHVVTSREPLVIDDARIDPRVSNNLAITDLGVIAYLGIPLVIEGNVIGSFCAIDGQPRAWTEDDRAVLTDLAESVVSEIRLRVEHAELERQRSDAEESRRRLQVTLSSIGEAVIATDARGRITFMNPIAESLCGWPEQEALGRPLETAFRIVHELSRLPIEVPVSRILAGETPTDRNHRVILLARDGSEFPIHENAAPIRGPEGRIDGCVLVFQDTSEKVRRERELSDARTRLDNALAAGAIATWTWHIPTDRVVADANLARLFSVTPQDANGGPIASYVRAIHPDDFERIAKVIGDTVANGVSYDEEYRIVQPDGSDRWVVARGNVERDAEGQPISLSGVIVDITDRKNAAERLRASEQKYRALFNSMDEGFCVIRMIFDDAGSPVDYQFLEVNPAFEKHTGLRDAVGFRIRDLVPNHEDHWFEKYGGVALTGRPLRYEDAAAGLDDRYFDVHAFRFGEAGQHKVAVLFNDITHRKRAEQDRERLVSELREADQRKDEFLAMLAHELRNPLAAIGSGLMVVRTDPRPEVLDSIREMIDRQTKHLTRLIDDLLDVSRIATGKIILKPEVVDLAHVVARAVDLVRPMVSEKRHDLTISRPDEPVRFVADPTRAEQILGNLLTNAAKYTEPGGRIHLDARKCGGEVIFKIRDSGVGIPAEMLAGVFGLFTQLDSSIDRSQGGLGIGLTLVKNLVEMHGGQVSATSEGRGLGSEFTVRLPIGDPAALEGGPEAPATSRLHPAIGRILVVDDNSDTARMTGRVLSHQGYEVKTANDGLDALDIARNFRPDVILLDIGLPGLNGYEVASTLRDEECCENTTIIAVSGYGESKARERSRESGCHHHLTKPLDFDRLDEILRRIPAPAR